MQRIIGLLLALSFVVVGQAYSAILVLQPGGTYTTKTTLEVARTAADTAGKTVVVTSALTAAQSNISAAWPTDRALKVEKGGSINPTTSFTGLPYAEPEWFGAIGDGTTDDSLKIQLALNSLKSGGVISLSSGVTYLVDATQSKSWAGTPNIKASIILKSNITIEGNKATLKAKNNISPTNNFAMLFSNESLSNISIRNVIFDVNGSNNLTGGATLQNAPIMFSGNDGYCDDLLVEYCDFINYSGTSVIITAQPVYLDTGYHTPVRNRILNNNFYTTTAALDNPDHSAIYFRAEDSEVAGNNFELEAIRTDDIGVAVEIQGKNNRAHHNNIKNYFQGFWVTNTFTNDVYGVHIDHNDMYVKGNGVDFSRAGTGATAIYDVTVDHNTITLDDAASSITYKSGVQLATVLGVHGLLLDSNTIRKIGNTTLSAGFNIGNAASGQIHDDIVFSNNKVINTYIGVNISPAAGAIGDIQISNNSFTDLFNPTGYSASTGLLIYANGVPIRSVQAFGNTFVDSTGVTRLTYGEYIVAVGAGSIGFVDLANKFLPAATTPYTESGTITYNNSDRTGAWTPIPTNLTVVGTPTYVGTYRRQGKLVFCTMTISATTSTAATTATYFSGLPFTPAYPTSALTTNVSSGNAVSSGSAQSTFVYPGGWTATGNTLVTTFTYIIN